jgi:hypothetical protein
MAGWSGSIACLPALRRRVVIQAVKVRLVAFGNDQYMPRIQGPMGQKGQEVLVFINGIAGDMPRHNRTKDTGVVPRLHQYLSSRANRRICEASTRNMYSVDTRCMRE